MKLYLTPLLILYIFCSNNIVYGQLHLFSRYKVPVYKGHKAKLKLKGNRLATMFRTTIKGTYYAKPEMVEWHGSEGQNFAGHYCFVYWGCGSSCQDAAVVDLKTGIVYHAMTACAGYEYKRNSKLVIVNPGEIIGGQPFCSPEYWVWNDRVKAFRKIR